MMRAAAYVYAHVYPDYHERKMVICSFPLRIQFRVIQNYNELKTELVSRFKPFVSSFACIHIQIQFHSFLIEELSLDEQIRLFIQSDILLDVYG